MWKHSLVGRRAGHHSPGVRCHSQGGGRGRSVCERPGAAPRPAQHRTGQPPRGGLAPDVGDAKPRSLAAQESPHLKMASGSSQAHLVSPRRAVLLTDVTLLTDSGFARPRGEQWYRCSVTRRPATASSDSHREP